MNTIMEIKSLGASNLYSVLVKSGNHILLNGYATKFKAVTEKDYVQVFTYLNSDMHNFYFVVDELIVSAGDTITATYTKEEPVKTNTWLYPDSTNIYKFKYVRSAEKLKIVFQSNKDVEYTFFCVPEYMYTEMCEAESKGRYFVREVKGKFNFCKVTRELSL